MQTRTDVIIYGLVAGFLMFATLLGGGVALMALLVILR